MEPVHVEIPGWVVLLLASMFVLTVPLSLWNAWLQYKIAKMKRDD
jgi:hypothetical protein